jgi:hypothetical protein
VEDKDLAPIVSNLVRQLEERVLHRPKRSREAYEPVFDEIVDYAEAKYGLSRAEYLDLRERVKKAYQAARQAPKPTESSRVRPIKAKVRDDIVAYQDLAAGEKRPGKAS